MQIRKLLPEDARQVAELHITGIQTGFISSLGIDFVTSLYEAVASSKNAFGLVSVKGDKITGFIAFAEDIGSFYKSVIFKNFPRFVFLLAGKTFSPKLIANIVETILYPVRTKKKIELPKAEFLSIVVAKEERGKGLSDDLLRKGFTLCRQRKIEKVKVLVGSDNLPANKLYRRCGFSLTYQINHHGVISNVYVASTDLFVLDTEDAVQTTPAAPAAGYITGSNRESALVTYGWCRTSYAVLLSLARRGIDVHVCDTSPLASSRFSRYRKSFTRTSDPFIEPDKSFEETCAAIKKTGASVLLPAYEGTGLFSKRKDELPKDVCFALPDWDSYRIAEDKFEVLKVAEQAGCPTPDTIQVESWSHLESLSQSTDWPVVIKTKVGNSAKGVRIVYNRNQLFSEFKNLVETFNLQIDRWPFLQEFLPGNPTGVCVLYDHGKCVASFAERYLRCKEPGRFGTSTLRESIFDPQLISIAAAVMDKLKWHGVAHLDFIADNDGRYRLLEVNPRLWGALALSIFSGIDFPYLWYQVALGRHVGNLVPKQYQMMKCRWIVGDFIAFFNLLKRRQLTEALKILLPERNCRHDDFILSDPLPFIFEVADYASKFIKSGGTTNPVTDGMIR